jgi:hypothetical protein
MASTASQERRSSGISRRALLRAGTALAAMGLVPGWASEADASASAELFVFRAPNSENTVIGLAVPSDRRRSAATAVRIHAGVKSWTADLPGSARSRIANDGRMQVFAGRGMMRSRPADAAVLELDALEFASTETFGVWAEILRDDRRRRVGNPIVAELLRYDQELAETYHRASPADDRAVLMSNVTTIITERARELGLVVDPNAYARRLANAILPDVISYTPGAPIGFSYAGQNGRHPFERTYEIVRTMLGGFAPMIADIPLGPLQDRFPYVISPIDLT